MIAADSHMAMVLPDDIAERIEDFVAGRRGFPFIERDEPVCLMYLYGKAQGVKAGEEGQAADLAERTAGQMAADIEIYSNPAKLDVEHLRSRYVNRGLQLAVNNRLSRLAGDPAVLSDCFAQHVAYHKQDYFFGLYGPLKEGELTSDVRPALLGRMVMVCYNRKSKQELSSHPLVPVYVWFRER